MNRVKAYRFVGKEDVREWSCVYVDDMMPCELGEFALDEALVLYAEESQSELSANVTEFQTEDGSSPRIAAFHRKTSGKRRLYPYAAPKSEAELRELQALFVQAETLLPDTHDSWEDLDLGEVTFPSIDTPAHGVPVLRGTLSIEEKAKLSRTPEQIDNEKLIEAIRQNYAERESSGTQS